VGDIDEAISACSSAAVWIRFMKKNPANVAVRRGV